MVSMFVHVCPCAKDLTSVGMSSCALQNILILLTFDMFFFLQHHEYDNDDEEDLIWREKLAYELNNDTHDFIGRYFDGNF